MAAKTTPKPITVVLEPNAAAALCRFMEKMTFSMARDVVYGHNPKDLQEDQAYQIVHACSALHEALTDAGVRGWPWVDTGRA